ncbi:MAG: epoxyqueuosine reductase [Ruminococcaceae bacterium]|nr:epoxyqueuosine reductase [Oscillospiraceae bacterium]
MDILTKLREKIIEYGAFDVGFFNDSFKGFENGISFYVKMSSAILEEIYESPTYTYFHHYRTVNALIDNIALKTGIFLEKNGYSYFCVPASQTVNGHDSYEGIYSHKKGAVLSGLGYVGKSGLFISKNHGSMIRLGTVFTSLPLNAQNKIAENECGNCRICINKCPAMALSESGIDRKSCSDYMKKAFQHIGRGSVCGICIKECPKNRLK